MTELEPKVAPSLLSSDFARLGEQSQAVLDAGADWLHVDAMDGHFVPNLTFGAPIVRALRKETDAYLDCHLMVDNPDARVPEFLEAGADGITVHAEAATHLQRTLTSIREGGAKAGVAVNPHTSLSVLDHVLDDLDLILVMTVNPGFGGQAFLESMLPKISKARSIIDGLDHKVELQVDGGVSPSTASAVRKAGATVMVAGSAIFGSDEPFEDRIPRIRG